MMSIDQSSQGVIIDPPPRAPASAPAPNPSTPPPAPGPGPPNRELVCQRERNAWELRCLGWSQARIGEAIGLTQSGVFRLLRRVEERVLTALEEDVRLFKVRQHMV